VLPYAQGPQGGQPPGLDALGVILGVKGAEARLAIPIVRESEERRATVGHFVRILAGDRRLIGMITEVEADNNGAGAFARVDVMGEILQESSGPAAGHDRFRRGVSAYPAIGDAAALVSRQELRLIYAADEDGATIGTLHHDETIPARISLKDMLNKHFAVLGSTGVGKSSGVAVILNAVLETAPKLRIFLLDGHNEFGRCFTPRANVVNPQTLKLPFWLFNFEELIDVVYGGRPAVEEELEILAEHIPIAKGMYLAQRASQNDRFGMKKIDPKRAGFTVDTPVPYLLQDLIGLIDERMGKLENRATRMHCHRLIARIETLKNDPRYGFMFENANVGGDTMAEILAGLFRLEPSAQPMTVMQLAGLPTEVVDAVVCVLARMAFDFGLWSDGAAPLLFVCEEAHRFAPADRNVGFAPTRRALMRIAKEGRKYGVYLGLVTQRPGEIDPTIISQCNTLFAMRLANERDQALLRSAVSDAVANLLAFVPSLGTREVVAFGEGLPLPTRLRFTELPADRLPHGESFKLEESAADDGASRGFVRQVVERWRGAAGGPRLLEDGAPDAAPPPPPSAGGFGLLQAAGKPAAIPPRSETPAPRPAAAPDPNSAAARLELLRSQILKRAPGLS
jgi:DNA helicase HerA-like ATPase